MTPHATATIVGIRPGDRRIYRALREGGMDRSDANFVMLGICAPDADRVASLIRAGVQIRRELARDAGA